MIRLMRAPSFTSSWAASQLRCDCAHPAERVRLISRPPTEAATRKAPPKRGLKVGVSFKAAGCEGYAPCRGYWIKKLDALSIRIPTQWPQKLKPSRQLRRPKSRSPRRALLRGYGRPTGGGSGDTTNGRSFNLA